MLTLGLSFIGFFNSLLIFKFNKRNIYLALFYLVISLNGFLNYFIFSQKSLILSTLFFVHAIPILNLSGLFLWFYVRGNVLKHNKFLKSDWIHLALFLFSVVLILPYSFQPWANKILLVGRLKQFDLSSVENIKFPFFSILTLLHFKKIYFIGYYFLSVFYLLAKANNSSKEPLESWKIKWFRWFFICVLVSTILTLTITPHFLVFSISADFITFDSLLTLLFGLIFLCSTFFFPKVLYGNSIKNDPIIYKKIELADSSIMDFEEKIHQYLLNKPYLHTDFTKSKLLSDLMITDRFFTSYFNVYLKSNFNIWKSNLRLDYSLELIKSGYLKDKTITGLANSVGFQSRSNFTEAFKKRFGSSPNEFSKTFFS